MPSLSQLKFLLGAALLAVGLLVATGASVQALPEGAASAVRSVGDTCAPDVTQPNGAVYRFCLPPGWDGGALLVYAHGYVWFNRPVAIPEDHVCFGEPGSETCVNDIANNLGIAFATTSYPTNGLAVLPAVADVVQVVDVFSATYGAPGTVLLGGVSEGGLVTTLALEQHPDVFDGGLAACGPIGNFAAQIAYYGDFRLLFDYFFPGTFPTDTLAIPQTLIEAWDTGNYFETTIVPLVFDPANADKLSQLLATSGVAHVPGDEATIQLALHDGLAYNIMATNEIMEKLGGNGFDNMTRVYSGSADDAALNASVPRFAADAPALLALNAYETSGRLTRPLITLQTSLDQQIPAWHEARYREKVLAAHTWMWHTDQPMPVDGYGHCNFDVNQELLPAFLALLGEVANPPQRHLRFLPAISESAE